MKSPTDVISGLVLLALSGVGFWSVSQISAGTSLEHLGPAGVPRAVLYLLVFLSILLIVKGWRNLPEEAYWPKAAILKKITVFILLFYAYLFGVISLGDLFATMENPPFAWGGAFGISTFLFLAIALPLLGRRKPLEIFLVASITTAVLLFTFGWFFQVLLP